MSQNLGLAGRLAATFIPSKLTPLLIIASMALGAFAIVGLPREEEPQIIVPMVDVFVAFPGATPSEVEQRVTRPMEKLLWEVPGVEYLYSTSSPGQSMVIVRFLVGEDEERALVRLNQKLQANTDRIPPGASPPLVKPRSIDDVPVMAVTLWGERYGDDVLRGVAAQLRESLAEVPDVAVRVDGDEHRVRLEPLEDLEVRPDPHEPCLPADRSEPPTLDRERVADHTLLREQRSQVGRQHLLGEPELVEGVRDSRKVQPPVSRAELVNVHSTLLRTGWET